MIAEVLVNPILVFTVILIVLELKEFSSIYGKRQIFFNIVMILLIIIAMTNIPNIVYPSEKLAFARMIAIGIALLLCFGDLFHLPKESVTINIGEIALLGVAISLQFSLI